MPTGVQLGSIFWRIGLKNELTEGVNQAKASINDLDASTKKAEGSLNVLDNVTKRNISGMKDVGASAAILGGALLAASGAADKMGGDIEVLVAPLEMVGSSMLMLGTVTMVIPPFLKSLAWAHQTVIPAILGHTAATAAQTTTLGANSAASVANASAVASTVPAIAAAATAEEALAMAGIAVAPSMFAVANGAMVEFAALEELTAAEIEAVIASSALATTGGMVAPVMGTVATAEMAAGAAALGQATATGALVVAEEAATVATITLGTALVALAAASVIGAVIAGAYLLYTYFDRLADAAEDTKTKIDDLASSLSQLKGEQEILSWAVDNAQYAYDQMGDTIGRYADQIKDLTSDQDELTRATEAYTRALDEQKQNADDIVHAEFAVEEAHNAVRDALIAKAEAGAPKVTTKATGTHTTPVNPHEVEDADLRYREAVEREKDAKANLERLKAKGPELAKTAETEAAKAEAITVEYGGKTPEDTFEIIQGKIESAHTDWVNAVETQADLGKQLNDVLQTRIQLERQIQIDTFKKDQLERMKKGEEISPEFMAMINATPELKKAFEEVIPKTVPRTLESIGTYEQYQTTGLPGPFAPRGMIDVMLHPQEIPNPYLKDIKPPAASFSPTGAVFTIESNVDEVEASFDGLGTKIGEQVTPANDSVQAIGATATDAAGTATTAFDGIGAKIALSFIPGLEPLREMATIITGLTNNNPASLLGATETAEETATTYPGAGYGAGVSFAPVIETPETPVTIFSPTIETPGLPEIPAVESTTVLESVYETNRESLIETTEKETKLKETVAPFEFPDIIGGLTDIASSILNGLTGGGGAVDNSLSIDKIEINNGQTVQSALDDIRSSQQSLLTATVQRGYRLI